jgi:hypothetical protein
LSKTLALIIDGGNDYIVTIKKNQLSLFLAAQKLSNLKEPATQIKPPKTYMDVAQLEVPQFMPLALNHYLFGLGLNT